MNQYRSRLEEKNEQINQSIDRPINQSTNRSIVQSINQSTIHINDVEPWDLKWRYLIPDTIRGYHAVERSV